MDNYDLYNTVQRIPGLKHNYIGSFPADRIPQNFPNNKFCIVNTDDSSSEGTHWLMLAKKGGKFYFADSFGNSIKKYPQIRLKFKPRQLISKQLQNENICGLYAIYFASKLFNGNKPNFEYVRDFDIIKYFCSYL